ncbi:bifunctional protein-serine/threonine kinase/phosphatase [Terasakiella sp. A23]|uniref:bifunctional protein-serine/threonine kinase/phosphatase n=1 Tax=Terasakiella sp. FCG-A23 TaxID=3080561 RepID=UPI0029542EDF|nr:bifunctional protein-serine/threonine kinase/phosphatase [Terasakiella sp. A23]MDV7340203.1 bifunctional protein-serine/threonine kinase/phosphatase [Terasakiella sp. A23]
MPKETTQTKRLSVSVGQYSTAGNKPTNQDFHGALIPQGHVCALKGITLALADGISSSPVSHEASETIVKALMSDYYCTSDAWSVKTAASRVISATNSWLYAQNRRARVGDMNRGMVCTLSSVIFKGTHAHLFHVGDSRIWRISGDRLEPLTEDHRIILSEDESYLGRSIGSGPEVEIDYTQHAISEGDIYLLTTDGVHEFWDSNHVVDSIRNCQTLDDAAKLIVADALGKGSDDNLTLQIARVDQIPASNDNAELLDDTLNLPLGNLPNVGDVIDNFRILRPIVNSARSHIYLAQTPDNQQVVLKFPSVDMSESVDYLRRFVMEEWISRRIKSPYVLGPAPTPEKRTCLYTVTEFVEGQTLRQWMIDNPNPKLEEVRNIIEQVAQGLRAFHRKEMLHQDLRPENIMIDEGGTVKIIDFGSTSVAGVQEVSPVYVDSDILGTVQYTAPEYFLGYAGTSASDLFSLGVIAYEMLTGKLPYGTKVNHVRTQKDLRKLTFKSTLASKEPLPDWIEYALQKAVHLNTAKRYLTFSEFLKDLRKPAPDFKSKNALPLMERNPVLFWQGLSLFFAATTLISLISRF